MKNNLFNRNNQPTFFEKNENQLRVSSPAAEEFRRGHQIHIWKASTNVSNSRISELFNLLSTAEKARAKKFRFINDLNRYLVSHGLTRIILGHYLQEPPAQITFTMNPNGKPSLLNSKLQFNFSHSGDYLAMILSSQTPVGIDIEATNKNLDWKPIAKSSFLPQEIAIIEALPHDQQISTFYQIWTQKEALLKALGTGLSGLSQITDSIETYQLDCFELQTNYQAAIAYQQENPSIRFFQLS